MHNIFVHIWKHAHTMYVHIWWDIHYVHVTSKMYEYLINMQPAICAQSFIPHINTGWVIKSNLLFSFNQAHTQSNSATFQRMSFNK